MKFKKFFSVVLSASLLLSMLFVPSYSLGPVPDFEIEEGVLVRYNGLGGDIVIPSSVWRIDNGVFLDNADISGVKIPDSVTEIGEDAFSGCVKLRFADLPNSLTVMQNSAFTKCMSLISIVLPGSLDTMGTKLFAGCAELVTVTFKNGFQAIPEGAFNGCSLLETAVIPNSVNDFGIEIFTECSALFKIHCPLESKAENYAADEGFGCVTYTDFLLSGDMLVECLTSPEHAKLPGTLDSIAAGAFMNCENIKTIEIPDTVKKIEKDAFEPLQDFTVYCRSGYAAYDYAVENKLNYIDLNDFIISGNTVEQYVGSRSIIEVPYYITDIGDSAFYDCETAKEVVLPEGIASIGAGAFSDCDNLSSINIPAGLTSLGAAAFSGCVSLVSAVIPAGITVIPADLFHNCISLAAVSLPANLTQIGDNSFYGCSNLTSITIPSSVINIGNSAFNNCIRLLSVRLPAGTTTIGFTAFFNCTALKDIMIPASVVNIGNSAFVLCPNLYIYCYSGSAALTYAINNGLNYVNLNDFEWSAWDQISNYYGAGGHVVIPNFVTLIHNNTFKEKLSITGVTMSDGLLYIGDYAFLGCRNMTVADIPSGVTHIGRQAFQDCDALTSVSIPAGITTINIAAFWYCDSLTNLTISNGVSFIGELMFARCPNLQTVAIPDSVTLIRDFAFVECANLSQVTIPASVTSIGTNVFTACPALNLNVYSGSFALSYAQANTIAHSFITSPGIVPAAGKTTVVDREDGFIYGLETELSSIADRITALGGASYIAHNSSDSCGTGSTVTVRNNGKTLEEYEVVIFGDINGDGSIDSMDAGTAVDVENYLISWDPVTGACLSLAGDLNADGVVDSIDAGKMVDAENYMLTIDQVTGVTA